jgi:putative hemolysin
VHAIENSLRINLLIANVRRLFMKKLLPIAFFAALASSQAALAGVAIPNPASTLCAELGGTNQSYVREDGGAISLCAFNDELYLNGLIEEWTLFRHKQEGAVQSQAVKAYFDHVPYKAPGGLVGHPALQYCMQVGGVRIIIEASTGDQSGVCEFSDGSQIEEWTLFRGPEIHQSLSKVLQ